MMPVFRAFELGAFRAKILLYAGGPSTNRPRDYSSGHGLFLCRDRSARTGHRCEAKPVGVGGARDRRGVLTTCNYEARAFRCSPRPWPTFHGIATLSET